MMKKKLLITGCGRSGTAYIRKVLNAANLKFAHEQWQGRNKIFNLSKINHGLVDWHLPFEEEKNKFQYIFHQIRHPIQQISSAQTISNESWDFIENRIPIQKEDSLLLKCMKWWYFWNKKSLNISDYSYSVEKLSQENSLEQKLFLMELYKIYNKKFDINIFQKINKKENTRVGKFTNISKQDLFKENEVLATKIEIFAKDFGYEL